MVDKATLKTDLTRYLNFEEDLIQRLATFYNSLDWRQVIDAKHHQSIEKNLAILRDDSKRHAQLNAEMLKYVEGSEKNDF